MTFAIGILYFLLPLLILKGAERFKLIRITSPVVCCYVSGMILGNLPLGIDFNKLAPVSEVTVLLSIPLLLFSSDILGWIRLAGKTVTSFLIIIVSVMVVSALTSMAFTHSVTDVSKVASMLVGVYTGGTPNLVAIGMALGVKQETFVLVNAADLIIGALYLLFAMTIGKSLLAKFLPPFVSKEINQNAPLPLTPLWPAMAWDVKIKRIALFLILDLCIVGFSVGTSYLFFKELLVAYIIMMVTGLGILFSFNKQIRSSHGSFETGEYLLLVFCIAIGSMANLQELISASGVYLLFTAIVLIGSVVLHFLLCALFKVDRDTALITSVAGIFGPAFVGPFAAVLKNREIVVSGVTCGLVGYALGTYLGLGLYYLLSL